MMTPEWGYGDYEDMSTAGQAFSDAAVVADLGAILFAGEAGTGGSNDGPKPEGGVRSQVLRDLIGHDEQRPMLKAPEKCPELTGEQIRHAITVVPGDYWQRSCWTCRDEGHSTFTCPYLDPTQRLYFAYRYYLYQIEANPAIAKFLEERLAWRLDPKNDRPRPFHDRDDPAQGRRGFGYANRGRGAGGGNRPGGRGGTIRTTGRRGVFTVQPGPKDGEEEVEDEEGDSSGRTAQDETQGNASG